MRVTPAGFSPRPTQGGHRHSPPTLVYRILGKFIFWMEALPWLGLWGPPSCTALVSPLEEQHLPRPSCWASGWRVWRSRGPPSPLPGQASTPWLPQPTAAEFNEGSGWVPAPQATENCNLASSSTRPEPHLYIEASQRHGGPPSPSTPALVHFPQAWIRPRQLGGGGARGARGPGRGAQASKALVLSAQALPRGPC